jgi:hypothetical protein
MALHKPEYEKRALPSSVGGWTMELKISSVRISVHGSSCVFASSFVEGAGGTLGPFSAAQKHSVYTFIAKGCLV